MANRLVTLHLDPASANLKSVREKFGLNKQDADEHFGVVCISPPQNLYVILADEAVASRLEQTAGIGGVFSNPKIEPYGPPR